MLKTLTSKLRRGLLLSAALVLVGGLVPAGVFADDPAPTCTAPNSGPGVHKPVGADASTYTFNCTDNMWENAFYSYNPATGVTTPIYPITYTYNPVTGMYDYTWYTYNAPSSSYNPITLSVATPPAGANVVGGPAPVVVAAPTSNGTNNGGSTDPSSDGTSGTGGISNTGPDSTNGLNNDLTNGVTINNNNGLSLTNLLGQNAATGDATTNGNTTAGGAATGSAVNETDLVNKLQTTSNALGGNAVTFVANINGDVNGDLLFDPASLGAIQNTGPSSLNTSTNTLSNGLTVNNSNDASITNDLNQNANTGNASVTNNTTGGSATTGNAENIANIVNEIDSMITAGQSFVGTININGNLNGNILLPANLVNQLLADNVPTINITGPNSDNSINNSVNNNATVNNNNTQGINNNVSSNAQSGNATVSNNTNGGNAKTGDASNTTSATNTSITAFNLTGSQVLGSNDILVFVNVTGTWVGLIVGAPAGTTAAEFGGGITNSGPNSNNGVNNSVNNDATINNNNNSQITNNINQNAKSGDASVTGNTNGGNATSGKADNSINLANIENSNFNLTGWFGILFINVFGSWHGNFGTEPSPGDFVGSSTTTTTGNSNGGNKGSVVPTVMHVFGFVSQNGNSSEGAGTGTTPGTTSNTGLSGSVLAANHNAAPTPQLQAGKRNLFLPIASVVLFIVYLIADRLYSMRQRSNKAKLAAEHAANIQAQAL